MLDTTLPSSWNSTANRAAGVMVPPRGFFLLIHALPDVFELPSARQEFRAAKRADFVRFFPQISMWCHEHGVEITAHASAATEARKGHTILCASGPSDALREFDRVWSQFLWRWGAVFSRRDRDMVMFVILPPPDDDLLGEFFPYQIGVPRGFDVRSMADIVSHPFTLFVKDIGGSLGFHDKGDRAKARLMDWAA